MMMLRSVPKTTMLDAAATNAFFLERALRAIRRSISIALGCHAPPKE
jgi:hypothetical protein